MPHTAGAPVTPAPSRPSGEVAIESWLAVAGLSSVDGLFDALLEQADDLAQLGRLSDAAVLSAVGGLRPIPRGLTVRKILAAIRSLRAEANAFAPRGEHDGTHAER